MGKINSMIIDLVEEVLRSRSQIDDDEVFNVLMDRLMNDTKGFWEDYKSVIPYKYHDFFNKVA